MFESRAFSLAASLAPVVEETITATGTTLRDLSPEIIYCNRVDEETFPITPPTDIPELAPLSKVVYEHIVPNKIKSAQKSCCQQNEMRVC